MKEAYQRLLRIPLLMRLSQKYQAHSAREKRLMLFLGAILCCICIAYALYLPALAGLKEAQNAYDNQRELLEWMKANVSRVYTAAAPARTGPQKPLPTLLADTAKDDGIVIKRLELDKDNVARLTLEKIPFNKLMIWLDKLTDEYRIHLVSLAVTKTDRPGQVTASLKVSE